jgi:hypothetical protein
MSQQPTDDDDLVRQALSSAVASHGIGILSDPRALSDVLARLLPGLPRGSNMLVAAARAGVASLLRQLLLQQHVDPATAVQRAARELAQQTAIEATACEWVTSEFARVLGYLPLAPETPPPAPPQPWVQAPQPPVPPQQSWVPPAQPGMQPQPGAGWPAAAVPSSPGSPGGGGSRWRTAVVAMAAVAVVLAAYAGIAAGTHIFPFARPAASKTNGLTSNNKKPRPPASSSPAAASLDQLLPADIDDPATDCSALSAPYDWSMTGVVQALACTTVPGLANGTVFAFQLDNVTDYETAWNNYNQWQGFGAAGVNVEATCPPSNPDDEGTINYNSYAFPARAGQVLECGEGSSNQPVYTWTLPTEYTFIVAEGGTGTSFPAMQTWWTDNGAPAGFPSPSPGSSGQ